MVSIGAKALEKLNLFQNSNYLRARGDTFTSTFLDQDFFWFRSIYKAHKFN